MLKKVLLIGMVTGVVFCSTGCSAKDIFPSKRTHSETVFYHYDEGGNKIVEKIIVEDRDEETIIYESTR